MKLRYKMILAFVIIVIFGAFSFTQSDVNLKYHINRGSFQLLGEYFESEFFKDFQIFRIDVFNSITSVDCAKKDKSNGGYINASYNITDTDIIDSIKRLKRNGLVRILRENNYLYFQFRSSFNSSLGIIHTFDEKPDILDYNISDITMKSMKDNGWYLVRIIYNE